MLSVCVCVWASERLQWHNMVLIRNEAKQLLGPSDSQENLITAERD